MYKNGSEFKKKMDKFHSIENKLFMRLSCANYIRVFAKQK